VPLGAQREAAHLLWLQPPNRLGADAQPLVALDLLVGRRRGRRRALPLLDGRGHRAVLTAPDRERLVLDDRAHPREQLLLGQGRRLGEEDLEPALVGVLGVLARERVASRGGEERVAVALDQPDRGRVDRVARARRPPHTRPPAFGSLRHPAAMIVAERRAGSAEVRKLRSL